jgi:prepilin-type N-terminal cleavage/methylation domain-containing protein
MHKKAFTMLELVLAIIVLGILASLTIPRLDRDLRQEAEVKIISAIRYTQNLALSDNKTEPKDSNWQQKLWQIKFDTTLLFYVVFSDNNKDSSAQKNEATLDPANGKYMYHAENDTSFDESDESPAIFLEKKYGIKSIALTGDPLCAGKDHIAFDAWGRPHSDIGNATHVYSTYLKSNCTVTFKFKDSNFNDLILEINAETGLVSAK